MNLGTASSVKTPANLELMKMETFTPVGLLTGKKNPATA